MFSSIVHTSFGTDTSTFSFPHRQELQEECRGDGSGVPLPWSLFTVHPRQDQILSCSDDYTCRLWKMGDAWLRWNDEKAGV